MARLSPIEIQFNELNSTRRHDLFWKSNEQRFREQLLAKIPTYVKLDYHEGSRLLIMLNILTDDSALNHQTNEHYHIETYENTGVVIAKIRAETIFGARHALETLSQLIVFDDIRNEIQMVSDFEIDDRPVFQHRGFLLDTARNYYTVESIKRTIGKCFTFSGAAVYFISFFFVRNILKTLIFLLLKTLQIRWVW